MHEILTGMQIKNGVIGVLGILLTTLRPLPDRCQEGGEADSPNDRSVGRDRG